MHKRTIMMIDDDADDRQLFCDALQEVAPGTHALVFESGVEALSRLQDNTVSVPDYIFLDINMPLMNGKECLSALKKIAHLKLTQIIMLSTSAMREDFNESMELGAQFFMTKPSSFTDLCENIRNVLENKFKHMLRN
ncbi:Response regulator receiver domain-containing protein [Chitinophaga jiangningensis]|uniref:Response regulator receiver domain-containing protein n=1 Tax=Chitinophaga jiangningensis TaxID=1419482 RepID=A0A1M6Z4R2_9BACT|nr:response regulator [Chitinophaga jiangningensis]SHL25397.1 Response regulator receiver domain-containing protein [Chitinophaga jiangningensis]